ncbi:MAG: type II toxin-antitoxin system VapC family toxin [Bacillota bacterium]
MTVAIDTNILFDILLSHQEYKDTSLELILYYSETERLIISEIVYSELASQFDDVELLNSFLNDSNIMLEPTSQRGLWFASRAWKKYNKIRDNNLQCTKCGYKQQVKCEKCREILTGKQHIISDFIIGGHAIEKTDTLLTRDLGFYRNYFDELKIVSEV